MNWLQHIETIKRHASELMIVSFLLMLALALALYFFDIKMNASALLLYAPILAVFLFCVVHSIKKIKEKKIMAKRNEINMRQQFVINSLNFKELAIYDKFKGQLLKQEFLENDDPSVKSLVEKGVIEKLVKSERKLKYGLYQMNLAFGHEDSRAAKKTSEPEVPAWKLAVIAFVAAVIAAVFIATPIMLE